MERSTHAAASARRFALAFVFLTSVFTAWAQFDGQDARWMVLDPHNDGIEALMKVLTYPLRIPVGPGKFAVLLLDLGLLLLGLLVQCASLGGPRRAGSLPDRSTGRRSRRLFLLDTGRRRVLWTDGIRRCDGCDHRGADQGIEY